GSSLDYFTGINWWVSERTTGMLLPKSGDPVFITPAFERERTLQQITFGKKDVRTWQENESPYRLIAGVLAEWHMATGTLGIEEQLHSATQFGIAEAAPHVSLVSATPVTAGCRSIKSAAELALMQLANDATLAVYHAVWKALQPGMTQHRFPIWSTPPTRARACKARSASTSASSPRHRMVRRCHNTSAKAP
ncbi:MAG: aminopeptidase P family N-terminal domain-containing protein, partial [Rhodanobacter sp.]